MREGVRIEQAHRAAAGLQGGRSHAVMTARRLTTDQMHKASWRAGTVAVVLGCLAILEIEYLPKCVCAVDWLVERLHSTADAAAVLAAAVAAVGMSAVWIQEDMYHHCR